MKESRRVSVPVRSILRGSHDPFPTPLYRPDLPGGRIHPVDLRRHQIDRRQQAFSDRRADALGARQSRQPGQTQAGDRTLRRWFPLGSTDGHIPVGAELGCARRPRHIVHSPGAQAEAPDRLCKAVSASHRAIDVIRPAIPAASVPTYIAVSNCRRIRMFGFKKVAMPKPTEALPGRAQPIRTATAHFINHRALKGPYPEGTEKAMFGLGCFWGAERKFWELGEGIHVTAVGYAGGMTPNPTYEEVCSGRNGQNEVVL